MKSKRKEEFEEFLDGVGSKVGNHHQADKSPLERNNKRDSVQIMCNTLFHLTCIFFITLKNHNGLWGGSTISTTPLTCPTIHVIFSNCK